MTRHRQILAARYAAIAGWQLSVIHGDFSAGNMLATPTGEIVLRDWEHFLSYRRAETYAKEQTLFEQAADALPP